MESFIEEVAKTYNGLSTMEQAIGEAGRLAKKFKNILENGDVNKVENEETPKEIREKALNAIKDFEDRDRPKAGNVPNDMIYQNHESMLEEAMNNLNTITNNRTAMEQNVSNQNVQTQNNEGMDR